MASTIAQQERLKEVLQAARKQYQTETGLQERRQSPREDECTDLFIKQEVPHSPALRQA